MSGSSTKRFPLYAKDYELFEEVGEGVSATVYRARCIALNENVAIKIMDLEKCRNDLVGIFIFYLLDLQTVLIQGRFLLVYAGNNTQGSSHYEFD